MVIRIVMVMVIMIDDVMVVMIVMVMVIIIDKTMLIMIVMVTIICDYYDGSHYDFQHGDHYVCHSNAAKPSISMMASCSCFDCFEHSHNIQYRTAPISTFVSSSAVSRV